MSCSGSEGPQGPPGPAGAPGTDGANGPAGEKGDTGNANINSFTFLNKTISKSKDLELELPAISEEVLEQGLVFGFIRTNGTYEWYPLSYVEGDAVISIFLITIEKLRISSTVDAKNIDIRIVVLEGINNTIIGEGRSELDFINYYKRGAL